MSVEKGPISALVVLYFQRDDAARKLVFIYLFIFTDYLQLSFSLSSLRISVNVWRVKPVYDDSDSVNHKNINPCQMNYIRTDTRALNFDKGNVFQVSFYSRFDGKRCTKNEVFY